MYIYCILIYILLYVTHILVCVCGYESACYMPDYMCMFIDYNLSLITINLILYIYIYIDLPYTRREAQVSTILVRGYVATVYAHSTLLTARMYTIPTVYTRERGCSISVL